jgi:ABC-2 type transport system ATP-binding protein
MEHIVHVKGLRKEYKEFVLDNISFTVPEGHILGVIGPNGAGKTTTIKLLMNQIQADDGELSLFNMNYRDSEKEIKNRIGYVGEEQFFYLNKTIDWTGKFVAQYYEKWDENTFNSLLMDFKLSRTKKARELSKGMKVKLAFAIALAHDPELLILDEPTSGLDPVIRREILDLLKTISQDHNKTVIISSHITDDLARIADYISFMNDGKIVLEAEKDELLSNWKKIHFKKDALSDSVVSGLIQVEDHMFGSCGITRNYHGIRESLTEGLNNESIKVENVNLDDILISIVREK